MSLIRRLALLLAFEGVALIAIGITYGVVGLGSSHDELPIELAAASAVLGGAVLLLLARGASRTRSWCRAPAIVLNVFPIPLALPQLQAGLWYVALPMALLGGTVLYLFATPDLRDAFREPA